MNKFAIMVDSGSDITPELAKKIGIYYMPMYLNLNNESFKDNVEITSAKFYEILDSLDTIPKTSIPSPFEIKNKLEEIKNDGYENILIITISDKLSGFNNLCESFSKGKMHIRVFNSKNVAMGEGHLAVFAKELADEGKTLDEVFEILEERKKDSTVFFVVNTLKYLKEGGRIGAVGSMIGQILSIKPIITCNQITGSYEVFKKARGKNRAYSELISSVKDKLNDAKDYYLTITHGGDKEDFLKAKEDLSIFVSKANKYFETELTPSLGANTGPLFGVGLFKIN
ncbi:MAG: DegV family protein [Peptoniphilaceae bacterium]|nr:DegV family protein [Peptoniphilaceae bacterium]MDD7383495.1 DegV family protein [Peptoniphilaceae bacterium]MDY3738668.1 DegV family protein [Peptoniphilaceae bacterium]